MTFADIKTILCDASPEGVAMMGLDDEDDELVVTWAFLACVTVYNCIINGTCAEA